MDILLATIKSEIVLNSSMSFINIKSLNNFWFWIRGSCTNTSIPFSFILFIIPKIADVLKNEGYIIDYKTFSELNKSKLEISLKYHYGNPVISSIQRVSKPGRRIFSSAESLPKINNGLGIAIVSTPKGVMTDIDARKQKIGGEIICKVF